MSHLVSETSNSPNIKVLHIASGDLWAGAEVQLFTLVKTLHSKPGIAVSVVLLNNGVLEQKLRETGIDPVILNESRLNSLQILTRLIQTIQQHKPHVIHTHRTKENILGSIAGLLAGRIPSLRTAHGAPEFSPSLRQFPQYIIRFLDWFVGRFIQRRIISVSDDLARIMQKKFPNGKIRVIENAIDLDSNPCYKLERDATSYVRNGSFRVGFAGRLVKVKRVDIIVQTARYMLDNYPDLELSFHIFGDGPMREELEALSRKLRTNNIIHFEGHCDDIIPKIQEFDVLLITSDHEGLPMVLLESMALRTPIIAHAVGGITNLLDHGSCGVLVQENNPSSYAHEIYCLEKSTQKRYEFAQKAYNQIATNYTAVKNASAYTSEYLQALSGKA